MNKVLKGCGIIALIGAVGMVGMCIVGGKAVVEVAEQQEAERTELQANATPADFRFEGLKLGITGVETPATIGSGPFQERPQEGASFVVVRYTIENVGSETRTVISNVKLVDGQGREFAEATRLTTALITAEDNIELLSQLMPGLPKQQVAAFEVPSTTIPTLSVKFGSPNMFESIEYTFPLGLTAAAQ